jgi:putative transposase
MNQKQRARKRAKELGIPYQQARTMYRTQQAEDSKKCNGNRRRKAIAVVAKAHRKIRNQRMDFLHKQSYGLVRCYEAIVFEDLRVANLSKKPKPKQDEETGQYLPNGAAAKGGLNKSINDAGWATFVQLCEYKTANAGTKVVKVNPRFTSQTCSACGHCEKANREDQATFVCKQCGLAMNADHNAAINILTLGYKHLAGG